MRQLVTAAWIVALGFIGGAVLTAAARPTDNAPPAPAGVSIRLIEVQAPDSIGVILDWEPGVPDGGYYLETDHYRARVVNDDTDVPLNGSQVLEPLTIDTLLIEQAAPGDTLRIHGAVQTVDTAGVASETWTLSRVMVLASDAPQPLPPLPPASVGIDSVPLVVEPPDTLPPDTLPPAGDMVFESDWSTARGQSNAALRDVNKAVPWDALFHGDGLEVVAAPAFPTANALRVTALWRGSPAGATAQHTRLLKANGRIPVPAVGESVFYRIYLQINIPAAFRADPGTHPIQDGTSGGLSNWELAFNITGPADKFYFVIPVDNPGGVNAWPNSMWGPAPVRIVENGVRTGYEFDRNTTYRFEWQIHRIGGNTFNLHARVYDSAERLLYDDDDFKNANGTASLADRPTLNFLDVTTLAALQVGLNGISGGMASEFPFTYSHQGAVCVRTDTWCGPYR